jgi:hypothetical protein
MFIGLSIVLEVRVFWGRGVFGMTADDVRMSGCPEMSAAPPPDQPAEQQRTSSADRASSTSWAGSTSCPSRHPRLPAAAAIATGWRVGPQRDRQGRAFRQFLPTGWLRRVAAGPTARGAMHADRA